MTVDVKGELLLSLTGQILCAIGLACVIGLSVPPAGLAVGSAAAPVQIAERQSLAQREAPIRRARAKRAPAPTPKPAPGRKSIVPAKQKTPTPVPKPKPPRQPEQRPPDPADEGERAFLTAALGPADIRDLPRFDEAEREDDHGPADHGGIPVPQAKPGAAPPATTELPAPSDIETPPWPEQDIATAKQDCSTALAGLDVKYEPLPPLGGPGGCGAPYPLKVERVAGVVIDPAATLTCTVTAALHRWIVQSVQPEAAKVLGEPVVAINNASSYVCRRRNGGTTTKISEHAYAAAFDVGSFKLSSGRTVAVSEAPSLAAAEPTVTGDPLFLSAVRAGACRVFSTVLGPGSNAAHASHFHFDLARGGRYLICE